MAVVDKVKILLEIQKEVSRFLSEHEEEIDSLRNVGKQEASWVIDFSRHTTLTLKAPRMYRPGLLLIGGHPPAPQPEQMRDSALLKYNIRCERDSAVQKSSSAHISPAIPETAHFSPNECSLEAIVASRKSLSKRNLSSALNLDDISSSHRDANPRTETEEASTKEEKTSAATVAVEEEGAPASTQMIKRQRQINISFGLSDSEDEDDL
jgi:hypothetical protein